MRKVLTVGVFDFFHLGHLNVLESAKECGDYLIVAVHDDKENIKGVEFLYSLEERMRLIASLKFVDLVISYERVDILIENTEFDVLVHGPDQNHQYFQNAFKWCKNNDKEIVELKRTDGISSSRIREIINQKEI